MGIKKHLKSVICLLLTMLMVFSVIFVANAAEDDVAPTGAVRTVYFRNTANWSDVYVYVWVNATKASYKAWPGEAMTPHEGNIYKYTVSGDYDMIIFNNNAGTQTGDLSLGQDGYLYDFSTKAWEKYAEPTPTEPTEEPQETQAPTPTTPPSSQMVYCENAAGWSSVYAYMWKDGAGNNKAWPGEAMENIGEDYWQYEVTGNWDMIIFNNGSGTQTTNLKFPGNGSLFNNKTNSWDVYDTSPITVKSATTDLISPQYKGSEITLSANATSTDGTVYYKFSVKNATGAVTVLKDFSTGTSVKWNPTVAGTYTLVYEFKDTKGNTNERTLEYVIEDDSAVATPIIKKVSPASGQVKNNTAMTVTVSAGGGKVGTNLLFYKYTVKDETGKIINVPYYTKKATYSYKPTALGEFTLTVSVQNAVNKVVERTYTFTSVTNPDDPTEEPTLPTEVPPTLPNPSGILGDVDNDGKITILDATKIQMHIAEMAVTINLDVADFDEDGKVTILDATRIQLHLVEN